MIVNPASCKRRERVDPSNSGFTLVELIIVIGIVALLVGLSIPSYQSFIMKSRRTEAKELLFTAAHKQQQYYTRFNAYTTNDSNQLGIATTSSNGYYTLSISTGTTGDLQSYSMSATPPEGSAQHQDSACGIFTLNSLGQKTVSGSQTTPSCW